MNRTQRDSYTALLWIGYFVSLIITVLSISTEADAIRGLMIFIAGFFLTLLISLMLPEPEEERKRREKGSRGY